MVTTHPTVITLWVELQRLARVDIMLDQMYAMMAANDIPQIHPLWAVYTDALNENSDAYGKWILQVEKFTDEWEKYVNESMS